MLSVNRLLCKSEKNSEPSTKTTGFFLLGTDFYFYVRARKIVNQALRLPATKSRARVDRAQVGELRNRSLTKDQSLEDHANCSEHCQSAILHFLQLVLRRVHSHGVEAEVGTLLVRPLERGQLDERDERNNLNPTLNWNGLSSLDWVGVAESRAAGKLDKLLDEHTEARKHRNAAVLQLASDGVVLVNVAGETDGVEACVANDICAQVRRRLEEGDGLGFRHGPFRDGRCACRDGNRRASKSGGKRSGGGDEAVHDENVGGKRVAGT